MKLTWLLNYRLHYFGRTNMKLISQKQLEYTGSVSEYNSLP